MTGSAQSGAPKAYPAWLKRLLPGAARQRLRAAARSIELTFLLRQAGRGAEPTEAWLARLSRAWGNEGYSGDLAYLRRVAAAARNVQGPVLECGSGLTTLLLAAYAGSRGVPVFSLEHFGAWRNRVQACLARRGLRANVLEVGLIPYDGFDWYHLPEAVPSGVQLVICDGPPGSTRGGRYGLLPVCAARLAPGCVILLDDAERPEEQATIERWRREFGLSSRSHPSDRGTCAELTVPHLD